MPSYNPTQAPLESLGETLIPAINRLQDVFSQVLPYLVVTSLVHISS